MTSTKEWALSHEDLLDVLFYNSDTGFFTWQIDVSQVLAGDRAGFVDDRGYRRIAINKKTYFEHRLAFFYMTGAWPADQLDHINGKKGDNRWENLREATNRQNCRNRRGRSDNTSGYAGVTKVGGRFRARVQVGSGERLDLGLFDTPEAAAAAYEAVAKEHFGEFYKKGLN
jgi:hypothetical protein